MAKFYQTSATFQLYKALLTTFLKASHAAFKGMSLSRSQLISPFSEAKQQLFG
jgi:hypothetical protein